MTALGITGHQELPDAASDYAIGELSRLFGTQTSPTIAFSSLAIGADQLFAEQALAYGGRLHAVIPCKNYESTFDALSRPAYESLIERAAKVTVLPFPGPSEGAFMAAGLWIVDNVDRLVAIWDGERSRGLGGTGDVVEYCKTTGTPVDVIWPRGVSR